MSLIMAVSGLFFLFVCFSLLHSWPFTNNVLGGIALWLGFLLGFPLLLDSLSFPVVHSVSCFLPGFSHKPAASRILTYSLPSAPRASIFLISKSNSQFLDILFFFCHQQHLTEWILLSQANISSQCFSYVIDQAFASLTGSSLKRSGLDQHVHIPSLLLFDSCNLFSTQEVLQNIKLDHALPLLSSTGWLLPPRLKGL